MKKKPGVIGSTDKYLLYMQIVRIVFFYSNAYYVLEEKNYLFKFNNKNK